MPSMLFPNFVLSLSRLVVPLWTLLLLSRILALSCTHLRLSPGLGLSDYYSQTHSLFLSNNSFFRFLALMLAFGQIHFQVTLLKSFFTSGCISVSFCLPRWHFTMILWTFLAPVFICFCILLHFLNNFMCFLLFLPTWNGFISGNLIYFYES